MTRLVLIRHSNPEIRADVPPAEWMLTEAGRLRATALAERLSPSGAEAIHSSIEPKAMETARVLGEVWRLPVVPVDGLHEHERPAGPVVARPEFQARIRELLTRRSDVVFGSESAEHALRRFTTALTPLLASCREDLIVVAHGTVMSLFVADAAGVDPFAFWKSLGLPCAVTLTGTPLAVESTTSVDEGTDAATASGKEPDGTRS